MAQVEVEVDLQVVFDNANLRERRDFADSNIDEVYNVLSEKNTFVRDHLEDADEDDIVEYLRSTGNYNIEEL